MGSRHFFQRRHIDDQQTQEKMLNITHHQANANQNHNELSPHIGQNGCYQKEITRVGEDMEQKEPLCTVRNVNCGRHYGKEYGGFSKN